MRTLGILAIGTAAGWLAGRVIKGRGFGLIGDLIVGLIGSFFGSFIFGLMGWSSAGLLGHFATAAVGAVTFLISVRLLKSI